MPVAAGASNLYFSRETKVYLEQGSNIWELPVLTGYSFSQNTNTSEITLQEMSDAAGNSRRGRAVFTDSEAPSEWSFSTYVRPYIAATNHRAIEEALWANFVAQNSFNPATPAWTTGMTLGTTDMQINFAGSNKTTLGTFNLIFVLGGTKAADANYEADGDTTIYKITAATINEVTISFDIDGIAMLAWSGNGNALREMTAFNASTAIVAGISNTNNFIRNRLTQVAVVSSVSGSSKTYAVTLTGGSITISNNITYLTPEVLGRVNQPLGHITGSRTVSGSFTAYLDEATNGTIDLFEDIANASSAITNSFALDFYIGGKAAGDAPIGPGMQFKIPNAHLQLPTIDIQDVISVNVDFSALPSTISGTDEITKIVYVGA